MTRSAKAARKARPIKARWSLQVAFWVFVAIVSLSAGVVLVLSKGDLWLELEMITGVVAGALFLFYWWILYHGVQFGNDERLTFASVSMEHVDPGIPFGQITSAADDPLGLVVAFIIDVLVSLVLAVILSLLIWIGLNGVILAIVLIATPLFYVFRVSVRFVLRNAPTCHGHIGKAAQVALTFTIVKTAWVFAVIAGAHYAAEWYKGQ
jgi:hypothetical protein